MQPVKLLLWKQYRELFQVWLITLCVALAWGLSSLISNTNGGFRYSVVSVRWLESLEYAIQFSLLYLLAAACNLGTSRIHAWGGSFESALPIDPRMLRHSSFAGLAIGTLSLLGILSFLLTLAKLQTSLDLELFRVFQLLVAYIPLAIFVAIVGYRTGDASRSEAIAIRNSIFWISLAACGVPVIAFFLSMLGSLEKSTGISDRILGGLTSVSYKISARDSWNQPSLLEFVFPTYFLVLSVATWKNWHLAFCRMVFRASQSDTRRNSILTTFRERLSRTTRHMLRIAWFDLKQQYPAFLVLLFLNGCGTACFLLVINRSGDDVAFLFSFLLLFSVIAGLQTFAVDSPGDSRNLTAMLVPDRFAYFLSRQLLWFLPSLVVVALLATAGLIPVAYQNENDINPRFEVFVPLIVLWLTFAFSVGQLISFWVPRAIVRYGFAAICCVCVIAFFHFFFLVTILPFTFYLVTIPALCAPYYFRRNFFGEAKRVGFVRIVGLAIFFPTVALVTFIGLVNYQLPYVELPVELTQAHKEIERRLSQPRALRLKSRNDFLNRIAEIAGPEVALLQVRGNYLSHVDEKPIQIRSGSSVQRLYQKPLSEEQFNDICHLIESLPETPFFGEEESHTPPYENRAFCSPLDASLLHFATRKLQDGEKATGIRAIKVGLKLGMLFNRSPFGTEAWECNAWVELWLFQLGRSKASFAEVEEASQFILAMDKRVHTEPAMVFAAKYRDEIAATLSSSPLPNRELKFRKVPFLSSLSSIFDEARRREFRQMSRIFLAEMISEEFPTPNPIECETILGSRVLVAGDRELEIRLRGFIQYHRTQSFKTHIIALAFPHTKDRRTGWLTLFNEEEPSSFRLSPFVRGESVSGMHIDSFMSLDGDVIKYDFIFPLNRSGKLNWGRPIIASLDDFGPHISNRDLSRYLVFKHTQRVSKESSSSEAAK